MAASVERRWSRRQRACHECDLLLGDAVAPPGKKLECPRCDAVLHRNPRGSAAHTAALSLTGLLLFFPVLSLPLLSFSILAFGAENTLLNGVIALFGEGYIWMAGLVLFCSVIAPLGKFLLLGFISLGCHWRLLDRPVTWAVRWYEHLKEWGMLDVYMLGLLVALIKMSDLGKMEVEPGLYCFVAMMLVSNLTTLSYDQQAIWSRLEERRRRDAGGREPAARRGEPRP
ncbi:paraquat-inducible protein A [Microbulbifer yueqingensis]|uniref:Paraquat-inducible protein A n=1 Tax=Microbulbifer yueqingensis TaxID=658219 RepID=A0A1G8YC73_9GAMM|nr:paraquat-inducible protein A [Microbulbifer yueqingensis]SDJ99835.1 paraquat-inducible protein A [Microbulbifer yueqingensis]